MKKTLLLLAALGVFFNPSLFAMDDIDVGRVKIPRAFIHQGKEYAKGVYQVTLTEKEGTPYFMVKSLQGEALFEELAVVKPYEGKAKGFKHRLRKEMLKGYEYYRIKVTTPDNLYMAYLLIKNESVPEKQEVSEDQSSPSSIP